MGHHGALMMHHIDGSKFKWLNSATVTVRADRENRSEAMRGRMLCAANP